MFKTMFTTSSIHVYILQVVHIFYNTNVAKKVTPSNLTHNSSTVSPQSQFFTSQAVKKSWVGLNLPTKYTPPTTTIFNKIENKKIP